MLESIKLSEDEQQTCIAHMKATNDVHLLLSEHIIPIDCSIISCEVAAKVMFSDCRRRAKAGGVNANVFPCKAAEETTSKQRSSAT